MGVLYPFEVYGNRGDMDDIIDLINQVKCRSEEAFNEICDRYKSLIDSMSRKYSSMCTSEYSVYDDFLQEAKMAFYKAIMSYDIENKDVTFGAYAKVCIRNRLVSCVRKYNSKKRVKGDDAGVQDTQSLQDTVVQRELGESLISVADHMLSKYEKIIFSMYVKGQKAKDISRRLGKSEKSVNNAIYRIRLKLKKTVK